VDPKPKATLLAGNQFCWDDIVWIQNKKPLLAENWIFILLIQNPKPFLAGN
jgi:hypothetical protein